MLLALILLPMQDNEGNPTDSAMESARMALLACFNGFTESAPAMGCWRDPATGRVYRDSVIGFSIAADWRNKENREILLSIAADTARDMAQESVFVALPSGVVFVSPAAAPLALWAAE